MKIKKYLAKHGGKLAVAAVLVVLILALAGTRTGKTGFLRNADGALKTPVQKASSSVLDWAEGLYGRLYEYDRLLQENESLRGEIAAMKKDARDFAELKAENERLRALCNLREQHTDYVFESAKILAWDSSNYTSAFTISKGSDMGIEAGDPVVTEYGALVGQITELGNNWATVRTVIDVEMDFGALVGESRFPGVLVGDYALMRQGCTRITYLPSGTLMTADDEVLTSGKGGSFPAGLPVGRITAVMTEAGGQTQYGIVEPDVDLNSLTQVFIIKDYDIVE